MSGQQGDLIWVLGEIVGELLTKVMRPRNFDTGAALSAARATRRAEKKARAQRQAVFQTMRRQIARVSAGDATEAEALAALRGTGGPPNPLDGRKFR